MQTKHLAAAFVKGEHRGSIHNACLSLEDGTAATGYRLHGHLIAKRTRLDADRVNFEFDWCGWHTSTTARHLNAILDAVGFNTEGCRVCRVSYSSARDGKAPERFTITASIKA